MRPPIEALKLHVGYHVDNAKRTVKHAAQRPAAGLVLGVGIAGGVIGCAEPVGAQMARSPIPSSQDYGTPTSTPTIENHRGTLDVAPNLTPTVKPNGTRIYFLNANEDWSVLRDRGFETPVAERMQSDPNFNRDNTYAGIAVINQTTYSNLVAANIDPATYIRSLEVEVRRLMKNGGLLPASTDINTSTAGVQVRDIVVTDKDLPDRDEAAKYVTRDPLIGPGGPRDFEGFFKIPGKFLTTSNGQYVPDFDQDAQAMLIAVTKATDPNNARVLPPQIQPTVFAKADDNTRSFGIDPTDNPNWYNNAKEVNKSNTGIGRLTQFLLNRGGESHTDATKFESVNYRIKKIPKYATLIFKKYLNPNAVPPTTTVISNSTITNIEYHRSQATGSSLNGKRIVDQPVPNLNTNVRIPTNRLYDPNTYTSGVPGAEQPTIIQLTDNLNNTYTGSIFEMDLIDGMESQTTSTQQPEELGIEVMVRKGNDPYIPSVEWTRNYSTISAESRTPDTPTPAPTATLIPVPTDTPTPVRTPTPVFTLTPINSPTSTPDATPGQMTPIATLTRTPEPGATPETFTIYVPKITNRASFNADRTFFPLNGKNGNADIRPESKRDASGW